VQQNKRRIKISNIRNSSIATVAFGKVENNPTKHAMRLFRYKPIAADVAPGLVEIVVGTPAGAALYKEPPAGVA
jgi:hypothetical protein